MNAIEILRMTLDMGSNMTISLIDDMKDACLTSPTAKGGNHPLWVLGHLAYSEASMTNGIMFGDENPLADWKEIFADGTEPCCDASVYPPYDEVRARFDGVRANTLKILDGLAEADLDTKCKKFPEEWEAFFGTYGRVLNIVGAHTFMHHGQVADARRMAGRKSNM